MALSQALVEPQVLVSTHPVTVGRTQYCGAAVGIVQRSVLTSDVGAESAAMVARTPLFLATIVSRR